MCKQNLKFKQQEIQHQFNQITGRTTESIALANTERQLIRLFERPVENDFLDHLGFPADYLASIRRPLPGPQPDPYSIFFTARAPLSLRFTETYSLHNRRSYSVIQHLGPEPVDENEIIGLFLFALFIFKILCKALLFQIKIIWDQCLV